MECARAQISSEGFFCMHIVPSGLKELRRDKHLMDGVKRNLSSKPKRQSHYNVLI